MQITLAQELQKVKNPSIFPKQEFSVKITSKVQKNILSFKTYTNFTNPFPITPLSDNFILQKRNGNFHEIIGETFLLMRAKHGYERVHFYVVDSLYGSAYITSETAQFLKN